MNYILSFIILICLWAGPLAAQTATDTQAEIETFLIQEWIHTPVAASIDQHTTGKCEGGKSYLFFPKGVLEIRECNNSRMRTTRQTWTLNQSEYGDWQVQIADVAYSLERKSTPGKSSIVLMPVPPAEGAETPSLEPARIALYRLVPVAEEATTSENEQE